MPEKNNIKSKKGFTIIEVVLVLAIAGLIFLMVFIALPALQRSQRDTQRRNDYSMLSTAVTSYISNNGGKVSKLANGDSSYRSLAPEKWINAEGTDPNGEEYELIACTFNSWNGGKCNAGAKAAPAAKRVYVITGASCAGTDANGNSQPATNKGIRAFVIYGYLESGGFYCQENNKA